MIIGVTGDTHNNLKNIKVICSIFNENRVDKVFHTGDISLPKSLIAFKDLNCPLYAILGNNDISERYDLEIAAKEFECNIFEEPYFERILDKKISVLHHPELIDENMTKEHDLILHGHTHRFRSERVDNCLIFNPGECAGFMKGKNQVGIISINDIKAKVINF
jgi:putative phosphoesterase